MAHPLSQCPLAADQGADEARAALFDDPNQQQFLLPPSHPLRLETLRSFVEDFEGGSLVAQEEAVVPVRPDWREGTSA